MNEHIPGVPSSFKPKSFWEKPEGVTGQIVAVSAIAGAGYVLYECLPKIITLLENTLYAGVLGVTAIAFAYVATDRRFWRLGAYLYQNSMRAITRLFVEIDPIGIMRT